jgi:hypothetical protein
MDDQLLPARSYGVRRNQPRRRPWRRNGRLTRSSVAGPILAILLALAAVWIGGTALTVAQVWRAPWVIPPGVALEGEPEIGVAYDVRIWTHCGLRNVDFDGDLWSISGVPTDGLAANPPAGFGNPFDDGVIVLRTPSTAVYYSQFGVQRTLVRGEGLPAVEHCL